MSRSEREGYVEAELREAERNAMSKNDPHDAGPVKIEYDDGYESPAFRGEKDGWIHDTKHGVIIRHHPLSRKAKFDPESLKNCPVPTCMLSDTRLRLFRLKVPSLLCVTVGGIPNIKPCPFIGPVEPFLCCVIMMRRESRFPHLSLGCFSRVNLRMRSGVISFGLLPVLSFLLKVGRRLRPVCVSGRPKVFGKITSD